MSMSLRTVLGIVIGSLAMLAASLAMVPAASAPASAQTCSKYYDPCVPPAPPYLNCDDIDFAVRVYGGDPHGFDRDGDGIGCQSNGTPPSPRVSTTTTTRAPDNQLPIGVLDVVAAPRAGWISFAGWAHDPDTIGSALMISVTLNSALVTEIAANQFRPDVGDTLPGEGRDNHGYVAELPAEPGVWEICTLAQDGNIPDLLKLLGCQTINTGPSGSSSTTTALPPLTQPPSSLPPSTVPPSTVPPSTVLPAGTCFGMTATIVGTSGDDVLIGTDKVDVIIGGGGDDVIKGRGGDDLICSGGGDDFVWGNNGNDRIHGGTGNDLIRGQKGDDELRGGPGDDKLVGHAGDDELYGNSGRDRCTGNKGNDQAFKCEVSRSL